MSDEVVVGLVTALAMVIVGLLTLCGILVRKRNNSGGNPGRSCPGLVDLKRDVDDVDEHMLDWHKRLERNLEAQAAATQGQTTVLNEIRTLLDERLPRQTA